jgi:chromosome segregation ATPase
MTRMKNNRYAIIALLLFSATLVAADQSPAEAKLRESLRSTMLQLRTVQGERDALAAEKAQLDQEKKAAVEKAEALRKQLVADKDAADKALANLTEKLGTQAARIGELEQSLEKCKASHKEAVELVRAKEAARATASAQNLDMRRKVADQQMRNRKMYEAGQEILSRYEKFALGTAITAREPFVGTMRVKLENLVQEYTDKLDAQRIKPDAAR